MYTLLSLISIIASVLLVIIVLLQSSKGGGLAGITGGAGNFGTMFGSRRTADFLSKTTWWLASIILGLALIINLFFLPGKTAERQESIIQSSQQVPSVPTSPALPEQTPATDQQNQPDSEDDSQQ